MSGLGLALGLAALALLLNLLAARHAWTMTHFRDATGERPSPEAMSAWQRVRLVLLGMRAQRARIGATPAELDLPFGTFEIVSSGGHTLPAWHLPLGGASGMVLILPSFGKCKSDFLPHAACFRRLGYAVTLIDFRGHGESTGESTSFGWHEADDAGAALAAVRKRFAPSRLVVYGSSMGAVALLRALSTGATAPDAVILECPFDSLLGTVRRRIRSMGLPPWGLAELLCLWGGWMNGFPALKLAPARDAAAVTVPTLLLHGEADPRVSVADSEAVFAALSGPKRHVVLPGVAHDAGLAQAPTLWQDDVSAFLTGLFREEDD